MKRKLLLVLVVMISMIGCTQSKKSEDKKNITKTEEKSKQKKNETVSKKELIVIDAGHQQHQNSKLEPIAPNSKEKKPKVASGTSGRWSKLNEYELTLQVALKLEKKLKAKGYKVLMIRTTNDVDISNSERAKIANENKADAFIRLHANGSTNSSSNGAMTICQTSSNPYNAKYYKDSKYLSKVILDNYVKETGIKKERIWETDTMSGINWCQVPVTILEMGYMSNKKEDLKMADEKFQEKMVKGISKGIDKFFNKKR